MVSLIWTALALNILTGSFVVGASIKTTDKSSKIIIVGAGASGISAAAKLLENGYNNVLLLEAENRIGGRVESIPFGNGYIDLGAQWTEGRSENVVYELVKNHFEFGDDDVLPENTYVYTSDGHRVDENKFTKIMNLSEKISSDYKNMAKFNESLGEFFEISYREALRSKEFEDIDSEFADQFINFNENDQNTYYASESWYNVSAKLNIDDTDVEYKQFTWKEHGHKMVFDFLTKKLPDPKKALPVDEKIQLNKEVTNIDWSSDVVVVGCADGSEYRADHVIVTVSLGFLKKHHRSLFTPQLPAKKINAIENTGFGTLGKVFLEFEEPFWSTYVNTSVLYYLLWKKEDVDKLIGTGREWIRDVSTFYRVGSQPNVLEALTAGKHIKQFEEISDQQLIDDCMWWLEKSLNRTLPRPVNMRRSRWLSSKYFLGSYSYASMDSQIHEVKIGKDLGETVYTQDKKPILLIAGEATDEEYSGNVHGAVASGWRAADEILDYYK